MRILQVVALVSGTNAYGGPTTVALNQCRALAEAGHEVILAAAGSDLGRKLPAEVDGVRTALFRPRRVLPGTGFAGLTSPGLLSWLPRAAAGADVVHVHLARDLLTLPAAWLAQCTGTPVVVQTHGMIDPSDHPLAGPLDAVLTRRVLKRAHRVFHLTHKEAQDLRAVSPGTLALEELHNGMPTVDAAHQRLGVRRVRSTANQPSRAVTGPEVSGRSDRELDGVVPLSPPRTDRGPRVLYLARMQDRKRPLAFVAAATSVAEQFPEATFTLVGPDEGQGRAVTKAIAASGLGERMSWVGAVDSAGARRWMSQSDVYVLPSINEPYPMSVLEAMAAGLPVVVTDSCGLSDTVRESGAGIVIDGSQESLNSAVARLLRDPHQRLEMGEAAARTIETTYAMSSVAQRLLRTYRDAR